MVDPGLAGLEGVGFLELLQGQVVESPHALFGPEEGQGQEEGESGERSHGSSCVGYLPVNSATRPVAP